MEYVRRIGSGGFGNVDLVRHNGVEYARKSFSNNQPSSFPADLVPNIVRRFVREAQIQAAITHRNIMPVIYSQLQDNPPWFIMPVAESSLYEDMNRDSTLGGNFVTAIMDILSGLEALHANGITHRDLKPQNVLRLATNTGHTYVISDFGLISIRDTQLSVLTQTGMRMGSDYYTAPEIVADLRHATPMSDIYSVGCILHDFVGVTDRIPCNEVNDQGPFADIIRCCTRRDPARRFQNVTGLRDAILEAAQGHAVVTQAQVADYIYLLGSERSISLYEWRQIVEKIEDEARTQDVNTLLGSISITRIQQLIEVSPDLAVRLGLAYAAWVKDGVFSFGACDGVANRLMQFYQLEDISCKVEALLALLFMGTSHNRWYVEEKFFNACGSNMNEVVARRFALEARILGPAICHAIAHLERSIGVNRSSLHHIINTTLAQIC